jgi:hypothetical protein
MISSLLVKERFSHQSCGVDISSARHDLACCDRVRGREQPWVISFSPQTPLRRPAFEAPLQRSVLFNINHTFLEA